MQEEVIGEAKEPKDKNQELENKKVEGGDLKKKRIKEKLEEKIVFLRIQYDMRMNRITTALFDFDGVVADTEPLYDIFWEEIAEKYHIEIPNFAAKIKGTTLQGIFSTYFAGYPTEETDQIALASADYELRMHFPEIPGAVAFLRLLKERGMKVGLVTSSSAAKMRVALREMKIESLFDTVVTADRITKGKPDPMCYLLAAEEVCSAAEECVVFEDSFSGIQAGIAAQMRVIGLSTTNPADAIRNKVYAVVPDFRQPALVLEKMN